MPNIFYRYGKPPFADANFKWGEPRVDEDHPRSVRRSHRRDDGKGRAALCEGAARAGRKFRASKIAVVGYCFSGAMALRTAAVCAGQVAAAASFHGGQLVTRRRRTARTAVSRKSKGELYFGHAVEDPIDAAGRDRKTRTTR